MTVFLIIIGLILTPFILGGLKNIADLNTGKDDNMGGLGIFVIILLLIISIIVWIE